MIGVKDLGITGFIAADWMLEHFKITFELITERHLMALISPADTEETVGTLIEAVKALHKWATSTQQNAFVELPHHRELGTHQVMSPAKAFFSKTKKVSLKKAAREVVAESVSPYPPGIPRLVPGELITETIVEYLEKAKKAGYMFLDPSDQELKTIRVVDQDAHK